MRDPLATSADRRRAREALSAGKRAYALSLRQHGATQAQIAAALALSSTRVGQILAKAEHLAARPRWQGQLPARALNFLIIRDLAEKPEIEAAQAAARLTVKELKMARESWQARDQCARRLACRPRPDAARRKRKGRSLAGRPFNSSQPVAPGRKAPNTCEITAIEG